MRKAILIVLLGVAGSSLALELAKWVVVDGRENFTIYADPVSARRAGNIAQMWDMSDAKQGRVLGGIKRSVSSKMEREYDCGRQQMRMLYVSWYAGNMGEGEMVGSDSNQGSWQPVMLGTIGERLWKIACDVESRRRL